MLEISFYNCLPKITIIWHVSFLRYKARQTEFVIWSHSAPLTFHKIKILQIDINSLWCTINDNHSTASEIWREMSRIFCHFGPFFTLSSHKQSQKIRMFKYIYIVYIYNIIYIYIYIYHPLPAMDTIKNIVHNVTFLGPFTS